MAGWAMQEMCHIAAGYFQNVGVKDRGGYCPAPLGVFEQSAHPMEVRKQSSLNTVGGFAYIPHGYAVINNGAINIR